MKLLSVAFLWVAAAGCAETTYRTAQGIEVHEKSDLLELTLGDGERNATRTLLANGAADLDCPGQQLHARLVSLHRHAGLFLVEGCGKRATYVRDCHVEGPAGHVDEFGAEDPPRQVVCELDLIGKVDLPRPEPAAASPTEQKASAPGPYSPD